MDKIETDLTIGQVAALVHCHPQTVRNYCGRGLICPKRDKDNYRRFSMNDVEKMKRILSARWPGK
jgi:DNA-binding transcriptional MerR regulator